MPEFTNDQGDPATTAATSESHKVEAAHNVGPIRKALDEFRHPKLPSRFTEKNGANGTKRLARMQRVQAELALEEMKQPNRPNPYGESPSAVSPGYTDLRRGFNDILANAPEANLMRTDLPRHAQSITEGLRTNTQINVLSGHRFNPYEERSRRPDKLLLHTKRILEGTLEPKDMPPHAWDSEIVDKLAYYKPGFLVLPDLLPDASLEELSYELPADPSVLTEKIGHDLRVGAMDMLDVFDVTEPRKPKVNEEILDEILPLNDIEPEKKTTYQEAYAKVVRTWFEQQFDWDDREAIHPQTLGETAVKRWGFNAPVTVTTGYLLKQAGAVVAAPALVAVPALAATYKIPVVGPMVKYIAHKTPDLTMKVLGKAIPQEYQEAAFRRLSRSVTGKARQQALNQAESHDRVPPELKLWARRRPIAFYPNTKIADFQRALRAFKTQEAREESQNQGTKEEGMTLMLVANNEINADYNIHNSAYDQEAKIQEGLKAFFTLLDETEVPETIREDMAEATVKLFGSRTVWEIAAKEKGEEPEITTVLHDVSPKVTSIVHKAAGKEPDQKQEDITPFGVSSPEKDEVTIAA